MSHVVSVKVVSPHITPADPRHDPRIQNIAVASMMTLMPRTHHSLNPRHGRLERLHRKLLQWSVVSLAATQSQASKHDDFIDDLEIEELNEQFDDLETVVPSDSVSQIGSSSRRHRSHRKHSDGSVVSKHSSTSKSSKHSSKSHRSHKSRSHHDSDDDGSHHSSESKSRRKHRPSVVSEPSDASTIKPVKSSSRKDSVTQGQYDTLFEEVQYGTGSVAVRGITPSMVSAAGKNSNRGMVKHSMAQKMKAFE